MSTAVPSDPGTVNVVRYPNRRLYDRTHGSYVTLPEIERMVREGRTVRIVDGRTEEDITRSVLTQIILERYPERMDLFPVPVLHLMIRANDVVLAYLQQYLQQSMTLVDMLQHNPTFNPFAASLEWMKAFLPAAPPAPPVPPVASAEASPAAPPASPAPPAETPETAALSRRIEELERRLAELSRAMPEAAKPTAGTKKKRKG